jgi:hypothetical protein
MGGAWVTKPSILPEKSVNALIKEQFSAMPAGEKYTPAFFTLGAWYRVFKYWRTNVASVALEAFLEEDTSEMLAESNIEELDLSNVPDRAVQSDKLVGCAKLCFEPIEIKQHRRVHRKTSYAKCVLDEVRCKFGVPARTEANRLAIRRFAGNIMVKHGVRPSQIAKLLPYVIESAFVPSSEDIMAADWGRCGAAVDRLRAYHNGATPKVAG